MKSNIGEFAALGTALCWSCGSIFFTIASRLIGSNEVNRLRLTLALFLLMITNFITFGEFLPIDASGIHWFWFGVSGVIGFTIGDSLLFRAFVLIGPRLTMLMMSLAPIFGTIIAWFFLSEILSLSKILAIAITLLGISWVILERKNDDHKGAHYFNGVLYGLGAAFCQALGLYLSKKGLVDNFSALSGNLIRIFIATIAIWLFAGLQGEASETVKKIGNKTARWTIVGGAFLGPFLGVFLSLVAIQHAYIGIASTLMALPPIILIPLSHWIFEEKVTMRAILGTIIAIFGVALIFIF